VASASQDAAPPGQFEALLRERALGFPEATEDFPWGHRALKVRGKSFAFLAPDEDGKLSLSVKLPRTGYQALALPFCAPTGYGLGRAGWVTATLPKSRPGAALRDQCLAWLDESYRAVAPKRLAARLAARLDAAE
jgi:predicted DNA-binding protein (MmcQ/YjbR family)